MTKHSYIPEDFYRKDFIQPQAETVGGLIEMLKRLPATLCIRQNNLSGCIIKVKMVGDDLVQAPILEIIDTSNINSVNSVNSLNFNSDAGC
jgi:hypothetical protein